jgi:hypothetical protein
MKINDLLEATSTPEDEAKKLLAEFQVLLDNTGVVPYSLHVLPKYANKSKGRIPQTEIYSVVVPNVKNGKYDADEAEIALRLAHRLISKWLDKKKADGHFVTVIEDSDVGDGHKFSTHPYTVRTGSKRIKVPSFYVAVSVAHKKDTSAATKNEDQYHPEWIPV